MPKIVFRVLSADDGLGNERMKEIMRNRGFEILESKGQELRDSNFKGVKNFGSYLEAQSEKNEIEAQAGIDLVHIKLRPSLRS
ncbi:MAG: hypothetical protein KGH65_00840 [Candidatus Micrarchaeota archaeon]|nr:hypothetical protein [Candidatus Micrarchaeota archaeon]